MESTYGKIIICFFLIVFIGCKNEKPKKLTIDHPDPFQLNIELQNGDLVFRYGEGYFSEQFRKYASVSEKIYSHGGIVHLEKGVPLVYHSEASEITGIGFVKKEPLEKFLSKIPTYGFYRMDCSESIKQKIVNRADYYFQKKTPFDLSFDISNDDKVYCSELVANAINYGFGKDVIVPNISFGNKLIYGVDNIYLNDGIRLIYKTDD